MKESVIRTLSAPGGGSPLRLAAVAESKNGDVVHGAVLSAEQGMFPIREGILDFLPLGAGIMSPAQRSNLFTPVARFYENPWRVNSLTLLSGQQLPIAREREILFDLLGDLNGTLWLDLAASSGLYSRWLAPRLTAVDGEVICLDLSPQMLRQARARVKSDGLTNVSCVRARAERLPFSDDSLDGVLCGGSLNEFGDPGVHPALNDLSRALKPGGVALFMHLLRTSGNPGQFAQAAATKTSGIAFWDRAESDALFEQHGLAVEESVDIGVVGFTRVMKRA